MAVLGGRMKRLVGVAVTATAVSTCSVAYAQIPQLQAPRLPETPVTQPIQQVADQASDAANQVTNQVNQTVNPSSGGGNPPSGDSGGGSSGGGGSTPSSSGGSSGGGSSGGGSGGDEGGSGGGSSDGGGATAAERRAERRADARAATRRAERRERAGASGRDDGERGGSGDDGSPGPLRPIRDVVEVIPTPIWIAMGLLALLAGIFYVRGFSAARRARRLESQRAELLDDIGVLSRALLPPVPGGLDGLAVSAAYRPADGPAAGGDFYDVFVIGERRVCVLVGDVSGHGRQSVTQAALARYTLRTLLAAGHPPGEALARADSLLERDLKPNFVTVIAGVYDPVTGDLTYAKAGHAPPIVLGAEHDPEGEQPAPPLALGLGETWPEFHVQLDEGVSVCLFTDGLEDARLGDARVGRAAVAGLLAAQDVPEAGRLLLDLEQLANLMCDDTAAIVLSRR
jgi:Stage II sporulation protein E (SpoIIE)